MSDSVSHEPFERTDRGAAPARARCRISQALKAVHSLCDPSDGFLFLVPLYLSNTLSTSLFLRPFLLFCAVRSPRPDHQASRFPRCIDSESTRGTAHPERNLQQGTGVQSRPRQRQQKQIAAILEEKRTQPVQRRFSQPATSYQHRAKYFTFSSGSRECQDPLPAFASLTSPATPASRPRRRAKRLHDRHAQPIPSGGNRPANPKEVRRSRRCRAAPSQQQGGEKRFTAGSSPPKGRPRIKRRQGKSQATECVSSRLSLPHNPRSSRLFCSCRPCPIFVVLDLWGACRRWSAPPTSISPARHCVPQSHLVCVRMRMARRMVPDPRPLNCLGKSPRPLQSPAEAFRGTSYRAQTFNLSRSLMFGQETPLT